MAREESEVNPYAAPKEGSEKKKRTKKKVRAEDDDNDNDRAIQDIVQSFQKTRSWISFFATLSYIGAVVLAIAGIVILAMSSNTSLGRAASVLGPFGLVLYGGLAALYVVIGGRLVKYRDAINNVIRNDGQLEHIADAVERQAQFWTLVGQIAVATLVLYGIIIALGAMAGASKL
jgi:hypothetical protein